MDLTEVFDISKNPISEVKVTQLKCKNATIRVLFIILYAWKDFKIIWHKCLENIKMSCHAKEQRPYLKGQSHTGLAFSMFICML